MNIRSLTYFKVACEFGNLNSAARHLGITTQGLALALKRLAGEVGMPLLDVRNGRVEPTAYGRLFLDFSSSVDVSLATFETEMNALRAHEGNIVRLGCVEGFSGYIGEDTLRGASGEHRIPEVLLVEEPSEDELEAMLLNGSYDLAILGNPQSPALVRRPISSDPYYLWVHRSNRIAARREVGLDALDGERLAILGTDDRWTDPIAACFQDAGVAVELVQVYETMRIFEYACSNRAIGLTTKSHADATRGIDLVSSVLLDGLSYRYFFCYRGDYELSEAELAVLAFLESALAKRPGKQPS